MFIRFGCCCGLWFGFCCMWWVWYEDDDELIDVVVYCVVIVGFYFGCCGIGCYGGCLSCVGCVG